MRDAAAPWFAGGLRFSCTRCGDCCRGEGYVWVSGGEVEALAEHLGLATDAFGGQFLRCVDGRLALTEKPNHDCVFWEDGTGCTVYAARPRQCRTFPFWPEYVADRRGWERVQRRCPGAGSGRRYSSRQIVLLARGTGQTSES